MHTKAFAFLALAIVATAAPIAAPDSNISKRGELYGPATNLYNLNVLRIKEEEEEGKGSEAVANDNKNVEKRGELYGPSTNLYRPVVLRIIE